MKKYSLSSEAIRDLDDIATYLANFNIQSAENFIKRFGEKCNNLIKFPYIGRNYDQIAPNLRGILLDSYIILYQVTEQEIEIVRVVSGYRDLDSIFSDEEEN